MSRYYGSLRDDNDSVFAIPRQDESKKAIDRAIEIVGNRVDQYGVSEPSIQKLGGNPDHRRAPGRHQRGRSPPAPPGHRAPRVQAAQGARNRLPRHGSDRQGPGGRRRRAGFQPTRLFAVATTQDSPGRRHDEDHDPEGEMSPEEFGEETSVLRGRHREPAAVPGRSHGGGREQGQGPPDPGTGRCQARHPERHGVPLERQAHPRSPGRGEALLHALSRQEPPRN